MVNWNVTTIIRREAIRVWNEDGKFNSATESFSRNTAKLWNLAPTEITSAANQGAAKREIKKFSRTLEL